MNFVNVSSRDFCTDAPADYAFWEYLNQVVQEEPSESVDPVTLGFYAITFRMRLKEAYYYPNSAWRGGFIGGYEFKDNGALILDAYSSFFFYATGVTPAMDSKVVGQGSQYMAAFIDSKGNPLDGGKNYKLHLPPNIPSGGHAVYPATSRLLFDLLAVFPVHYV